MQGSYSHIHGQNCSCSSCFYQNTSEKPSVKDMVAGGSKIDKLFLGKFLPMREQKLLDRLVRTRAVYDDIRNQLLPEGNTSVDLEPESDRLVDSMKKVDTSSAVFQLVNLIDKGGYEQTSLSDCCSCCSCDVILRKRRDAARSFRGRARVPVAYPHRRSHAHLQQRQSLRHQHEALKIRGGRERQHQLHERHAHHTKPIRSDPCGCFNPRHKGLIKRVSKAFSKISRTKLSRLSLQRNLPGEFTKRGQHKQKGHHYKEWGEIRSKTGKTIRKSATKIRLLKRKVEAGANKSLRDINDSKHIIMDTLIDSLKKVKRGYKMTDTELAELYESSFDIPLHNRNNMDHDEIMNKWACEECDPEECVSEECFHNKKLKLKTKARHSKKYLVEISNMSISVDSGINAKPKQTSMETETIKKKSAAVKVKRGRYQSQHGKLKKSVISIDSDISIQARPKKATLSTYTKKTKTVAEKHKETEGAKPTKQKFKKSGTSSASNISIEARQKDITLGTEPKMKYTAVKKDPERQEDKRKYNSSMAKQSLRKSVISSVSDTRIGARQKKITLGTETKKKKTTVKKVQSGLDEKRDGKYGKQQFKTFVASSGSDFSVDARQQNVKLGPKTNTKKTAVERAQKILNDNKTLAKYRLKKSFTANASDLGTRENQKEATLETGTEKITRATEKVYKGRKERLRPKAAKQQSKNTVISVVSDIGVEARQNEGTLSTVTKKKKAVEKHKKNSTVTLVHQGQRNDKRKGYRQPSIDISVRRQNRRVKKAEKRISKGKLVKPASSARSSLCECKVALQSVLHRDADEQNIGVKVRSPKKIQVTASHIPSRHSQVSVKPKINISKGRIPATQHQQVKVGRPSSTTSDRQVKIAVRPKINTRRPIQRVSPGGERQAIRINSTSTSKELDKKPKSSRDKNVHHEG